MRMSFAGCLCVVALPLVASAQRSGVAASAASSNEASASTSWPTGSTGHGTRGIARVEGAVAHPAGAVVLSVSGQYSYATDLFDTGDANERYSQQIGILWAPVDNLELWLRQTIVSNRNQAFEPTSTQHIGDPSIGVKYSYPVMPDLGIAAGINFLLPTSAKGTGLNPDAFVLDLIVAASYRAMSWLGLHLNAGYRLDNTSQIFKRTILPVQRFTAGISQENAIIVGLGADTAFLIGDEMAIGPFAEVTAGLVTEHFDDSPIRATLGAKWFPFGEHAVELTVGVDVALAGTPPTGSAMAGIPPWELFFALTARLNPPAPEVADAIACTDDEQCPRGQTCADGTCARVIREAALPTCETDADCGAERACHDGLCTVVRMQTVPTFTVRGGVFDESTGDPVRNATVMFSGVNASPLAVDYKSGTFVSWPIEVGDGLLKITAAAPGYRSAEHMITKGQEGEIKEVAFKIQSLDASATGEIKGSFKDARNGRPIRNAQIFIPILNQRIRADKGGRFSATVKAGRYQVLLSARRYVTQKKEIEIRAGDTVILNLDMSRK